MRASLRGPLARRVHRRQLGVGEHAGVQARYSTTKTAGAWGSRNERAPLRHHGRMRQRPLRREHLVVSSALLLSLACAGEGDAESGSAAGLGGQIGVGVKRSPVPVAPAPRAAR
jgi:hypothetical protein